MLALTYNCCCEAAPKLGVYVCPDCAIDPYPPEIEMRLLTRLVDEVTEAIKDEGKEVMFIVKLSFYPNATFDKGEVVTEDKIEKIIFERLHEIGHEYVFEDLFDDVQIEDTNPSDHEPSCKRAEDGYVGA